VARERRLVFGEVAELYDRARPSFPAALVDDVLVLAGLDAGGCALEVGAGTGKATVLFAARGASVLALEPDPAMAAVAERNCAAYPNVTIERAEFEHWDPPATFSLVYSAQAWHWIAPELRYVRARAALRPGGVLAAFWNRPEWDGCALREELDSVYRRVAPELGAGGGPMHPAPSRPLDLCDQWEREIAPAGGFEQAEVWSYRWVYEYSTEEYLRLLRTHSDHIVLDPAPLVALLEGIGAVLHRHGGSMEVSYVTRLCLARAR